MSKRKNEWMDKLGKFMLNTLCRVCLDVGMPYSVVNAGNGWNYWSRSVSVRNKSPSLWELLHHSESRVLGETSLYIWGHCYRGIAISPGAGVPSPLLVKMACSCSPAAIRKREEIPRHRGSFLWGDPHRLSVMLPGAAGAEGWTRCPSGSYGTSLDKQENLDMSSKGKGVN